jgi:hypothetical protein
MPAAHETAPPTSWTVSEYGVVYCKLQVGKSMSLRSSHGVKVPTVPTDEAYRAIKWRPRQRRTEQVAGTNWGMGEIRT